MELFRQASTGARATAARFNAWTDRHRTALVRFWYLTSFAVLFGVSAYAGYRASGPSRPGIVRFDLSRHSGLLCHRRSGVGRHGHCRRDGLRTIA